MKKGITLIEVLVSSMILVISITALLFNLVTIKGLVRESVHKANAVAIINEQFEGIQRRTSDDSVDQFLANQVVNDPYSEFKPLTITRVVQLNNGETRTHNYFLEFQVDDVPNSNVRKIAARVSWDFEYKLGRSSHSIHMAMLTNNLN